MQLNNRKIVVTGGPTREWFDPFRYISNPSSGKMGLAIADEAWKRSRDTVFIHGPISTHLSEKPYKRIKIESTSDLLNAVLGELKDNSVLLMAAAPVDYAPVERADTKIKKSKTALRGLLHISRSRTLKILALLGSYALSWTTWQPLGRPRLHKQRRCPEGSYRRSSTRCGSWTIFTYV